MPTQSLRPKQAQPNARQQLKVQQLLIPEIEQLQQKELQAVQKLSINKPIDQIPRQNIKKAVKASPKPNRLEAPYKKPTAKPTAKPASKPDKSSSAELKKQKQEMLDWLNNVRIG
ncbi:possible (AF314193) Toutatis [Drosophila melanogaster] [Prochlorococcus marinus str. MIT 9313]|uniref:Possible (AF314193) Toutatis [Drosophila melanogaster] n=1 Tax=Prochlorococcus marinus (strain MIT 9313) TaxID=74547 RepID=Q7V442_PROMM|nr:hypothetical protein [Prochlorococcus marinus]CAE22302.1 possible (AF314193) Toutatis [Drosophila melanogaster] [Prochlorococcus marinus str. MIT 9313]